NAHVRRVREKIEADPSKPVSLLTVKGLGYKLLARK
ncbi:MAG: winged helix-turn-helix domain-containing protein, partial [Angelakisella sp.]|nr:winged helix-turn-helix domain-containing protein [Angelakisella sp.]